MSLINDALKRAKQSQAENPPATPPLEFRTVAPDAAELEATRQKTLLIIGVGLMLLAIVGLAALLVWYAAEANQHNLSVAARRSEAPVVVRVQTNRAQETVIVAAAAPAPEPEVARKLDPDQPDTNGMPVVAEVVAAITPARQIKLQGIFFNPVNPSAVVNGRTVYLGDRVNGFRLIAVSPVAVTFSNGTETNVLSLSQ